MLSVENPYGDGGASDILSTLLSVNFDGLINKVL